MITNNYPLLGCPYDDFSYQQSRGSAVDNPSEVSPDDQSSDGNAEPSDAPVPPTDAEEGAVSVEIVRQNGLTPVDNTPAQTSASAGGPVVVNFGHHTLTVSAGGSRP